MSVQITVRIADELVRFVDEQVATGGQRSRASVVERALRRELRRHLAEQDARVYAAIEAERGQGAAAGVAGHGSVGGHDGADDLAAIAEHRSKNPLDLSHLD